MICPDCNQEHADAESMARHSPEECVRVLVAQRDEARAEEAEWKECARARLQSRYETEDRWRAAEANLVEVTEMMEKESAIAVAAQESEFRALAKLAAANANLAECERERDEDALRWQVRVAQVITDARLEPFDASGNESGDPLDFTADQASRERGEGRRGAMSELFLEKAKVDAIRELWRRADGDAQLMKVREVVLALVDALDETSAQLATRTAERDKARAKLATAVEQITQLRKVFDIAEAYMRCDIEADTLTSKLTALHAERNALRAIGEPGKEPGK